MGLLRPLVVGSRSYIFTFPVDILLTGAISGKLAAEKGFETDKHLYNLIRSKTQDIMGKWFGVSFRIV